MMGSQLTIINRTKVCINVALKQIGPLYFKKKLEPGQEWKITVGE